MWGRSVDMDVNVDADVSVDVDVDVGVNVSGCQQMWADMCGGYECVES